jgi:serine protease Do
MKVTYRFLISMVLLSCFSFAPLHAVERYKNVDSSLFVPVAAPTGLPDFTALVRKVRPCVVNISTSTKASPRSPMMNRGFRDPFSDDFFDRFFGGGPSQREKKSLGSGFVINSKGNVLTNRHVISGADEVLVHTSDDRKLKAKVVGEDDKTDIAVLSVEEKNLSYCNLGNSDSLQIGEWVVAMGNPFGLDSTVTAGIVSAKGRIIGAGPYDDFIQTDASINPGNSGGPLFDLDGRVVGINTAIIASGQGIGFAIPINLAKDLIPQLISKGKVTRGWLGVGIQDMTEDLAKSFGLDKSQGALISNVFPGSPAEKGGIQAGDVILEFNGKPIEDSHQLPAQVARTPIGTKVSVLILRDGKRKTLRVKVGEREDESPVSEAGQGSGEGLGISVRDLSPEEIKGLGLLQGQKGVYIAAVDPNSSAARSDIRPGDVLLSINGRTVPTAKAYLQTAKSLKKGQVVRFFIRRGEMTIFVAFTK